MIKFDRSKSGCLPLPTALGMVFLIVVVTGLLAFQPEARAEEEESGLGFVEPILTEETLPNEPGELSLRVSADYRRRGSEAIGALPRVELFYGIVERLGAEVSLWRIIVTTAARPTALAMSPWD